MKRWHLYTLSLSALILSFSSFLYLGIKSVPLVPFINEVEGSQEDFIIIKSSLASFMHHVKPSGEGNYPISISFDNFSEEDADSLGYALVDNDSCEIFLNLKEKWTREKFNLTLYHELGHCYGLEHDDSAAIMEAEYNDPKQELKSLPLFWKNIKNNRRNLLVMNSGINYIDNEVNKIIDLLIPETKDSLSRVKKQHKPLAVKYQHNPHKKIQYQEK